MNTTSICPLVTEMSSFTEFITCLGYFATFQPIITTIYSIFIFIASFMLNLSLIILLLIKREITVFDRIITTHAMLDLLVCLIDFPFMITPLYFNYWPFSKWMCIIWVSYDNSLCMLEILTVLLMSWVRLRCIQAPRSYASDVIVKHIYAFIASMWLAVVAFWTAVSTYMLMHNFDQAACYLNFEIKSVSILVVIVAFLGPLCSIVAVTICIDIILYKKKRAVSQQKSTSEVSVNHPNNAPKSHQISPHKSNANIKKKFHFSPQLKLSIIIAIFCIQYMPYYITWFTSVICSECVSTSLYNTLFLLSYFPSIVNPVVMFILNKSLLQRFKCK